MLNFIKKTLSIKPSIYFLYYFTLVFFSVVAVMCFAGNKEQQFSYLAQSFLHGKTYFLSMPDRWMDAVPYNGLYYWPLGPMPAVVLMPFVYIFGLFHVLFLQGYLQLPLGIITFFLIYKIAKKFNYSHNDSFLWSFAFIFSSMYIGVFFLPWSWWFAQIFTVTLLFALLYEFLGKKRTWLLSLITASLLLSRITAGLTAIIFLTLNYLFIEKNKRKIKDLSILYTFIVSSVVVFFTYNYIRFDNIFETGYNLQIIHPVLTGNREIGIYSLKHFPANFYYCFLSLPKVIFYPDTHVARFPYFLPDPWGMSIFLTSPYLLLLFLYQYKKPLEKIILVSSFVSLIAIFLYYGIGYQQFGYRYALDFLPFIFVLLMYKYKEAHSSLSFKIKILIVTSAFFNFYMNILFH